MLAQGPIFKKKKEKKYLYSIVKIPAVDEKSNKMLLLIT